MATQKHSWCIVTHANDLMLNSYTFQVIQSSDKYVIISVETAFFLLPAACLTGIIVHRTPHWAPPPVSNIFLRPSMPDMASTFLRQSPTSVVSTWGWNRNQDVKIQERGLPYSPHLFKTVNYLVLFDVLLLHRLEVGSEVHGALVFGPQQSSHHLVCRHPHLPQGGLFELASQVLNLQLQLVDLK